MSETLSKYGTDISVEIADAAGRDGAMLIINLAADDERSPINAGLVRDHAPELIKAAAELKEKIGAEKVCVVSPEDISLSVPDAETVRVKRSRVLREESALFHIIETGELRSCPPEKAYPSEGPFGKPAVAVDGETLYRIGSGETGKTVVVRSGGDVKTVTAEIGKKVSEIIAEAGFEAKKPTLVGGVTGTFIAEPGDTAVSYSDLFDSITVYGEKDCMAHETALLMRQSHEESCAKCVICREGTWHLSGIFSDIISGKGKKEDLDMVADIGPLIHIGSFCSFGQNTANVAVSSAELNKEELLVHIVKKQCPAMVCAAFNKTTYCIDPEKCVGCGDCEDECPEMAIEGKAKFIYMIDADMCTGCGDCVSSCDEDAILVNDGSIRLPKKLTKVGKF